MADLLCSDGAVRAADTLLRANGGRAVMLRIPAPAVANSDGEQLGVATPQFQDVDLAPVAFRKLEKTTMLLVSGNAVQSIVGSLQFNSAEVLFETAVGVVVDSVLYTILSNTASTSDGKTYVYSLELRAPDR
ncbi:MAG TPA: hypothetical protein VFA99_12000 [Acidobacteriaceae bacterium]|nr:hypothetical protein [Acidobacteriaceae bacterium]